MPRRKNRKEKDYAVLESRLAYHLRCLREDAKDPERTSLERLALVPDRTKRIREISRMLAACCEHVVVSLSPGYPTEGNRAAIDTAADLG